MVQSCGCFDWSDDIGIPVRNQKYMGVGTVAFAISLPVGILETTSTQNDLLGAFWLIGLLVFIFCTYDHDECIQPGFVFDWINPWIGVID